MNYDAPLTFGTLIRRYKRFLADIELDDGQLITAHCPNTGRMTTCAKPGWKVALSTSDNPKRKYRHTWELVHNGQCWISVNTGRTNAIAAEAILNDLIPELTGYPELLREQTFGNSRFDLLLRNEDQLCYVEVKSVTLVDSDGCYIFPDAPTERGRKHLKELAQAKATGHRAVMLFVIQRSDGSGFRPASEIDPAYASGLKQSIVAGVEAYAWQAEISPEGILLQHSVPVVID